MCDRVFVTVCLSPEATAVCVQGVAVELRHPSGDALSARLMLPISGELAGPLALRTELRSRDDIPRGSRVHGTVWYAGGQLDASCPTDPGTSLEAFAYGSPIRLPNANDSQGPTDLSPTERCALLAAYPWMSRYRSPVQDEDDSFIPEQPADLASDIADTYGLSDEDREFLQELLTDEEPLDDLGWDDDDPTTASA
jgi:hypothetical protein